MIKATVWIFLLCSSHLSDPNKDLSILATGAVGSISGALVTLCLFRKEIFQNAE